MVQPASAQLGGTEKSSFTVQNISDSTATVAVEFVAADGTKYSPADLVPSANIKNPFTLAAGKSQEIYVPNIPTNELPSGRYSVVISSDQPIVASANVLGEGTINFNGSYNGLAAGSKTFYLPAFSYNYYGWYSMVTVQNVGSAATDVTVTINCSNGVVGTYSKTGLPASASITFDSKSTLPTGFATTTKCDGSAVVSSTVSDVIAVDNQTVPTGGFTQSYTGVIGGGQTIYAPVLQVSYYNWDSSINVLKIAPGNTTVTLTYSDGATPSTFDLTDAIPGHLFYMPTVHPLGAGALRALFAATITSSNPAVPIVAVVNAGTKGTGQAVTYNAVTDGTSTIVAPGLFKNYYGWISSVTCQNVSATPTKVNISYEGYAANAYDSVLLNQNQTVEFLVFKESFLGGSSTARWNGGAIITATVAGAKISCVIGHNNPVQMASTQGDWSTSLNAFSK